MKSVRTRRSRILGPEKILSSVGAHLEWGLTDHGLLFKSLLGLGYSNLLAELTSYGVTLQLGYSAVSLTIRTEDSPRIPHCFAVTQAAVKKSAEKVKADSQCGERFSASSQLLQLDLAFYESRRNVGGVSAGGCLLSNMRSRGQQIRYLVKG